MSVSNDPERQASSDNSRFGRYPWSVGDWVVPAAPVVARQVQSVGKPPSVDAGSAQQGLDDLAELIKETQEGTLRARLVHIQAQLRGSPADHDATAGQPFGRLSRREIDVLRLVAVGETNLEIAAQLRLSPETVKAYLRAAMRKLGARNRTGAVHAGRLLGVLLHPKPGRFKRSAGGGQSCVVRPGWPTRALQSDRAFPCL